MNVPDDLGKAYQSFFLKHEAGKYFVSILTELIESQHTKAEDNPVLSRDYTQRAKGIREIINHIDSVSVERKPRE